MRLPDDYTPQTPNNYDLVTGFLQVFDVLLNVSQVSNDKLLDELQHQNSDYLEKILHEITELKKDMTYSLDKIALQNSTMISQNEKILKKLGC